VTREEVIRAYAKYDRRKKAESILPSDIDEWPWDDPGELDSKLRANGLKSGVLAAYRDLQLVEFSLPDDDSSRILRSNRCESSGAKGQNESVLFDDTFQREGIEQPLCEKCQTKVGYRNTLDGCQHWLTISRAVTL
jgi:hypothetical protein